MASRAAVPEGDRGRSLVTFHLRGSTMVVVLAASAVVAAGTLAAAPFLLLALRGQTEHWGELSNVATTYGAASAVLSALALAGVAVSLVFQAREMTANREQTLRSLHVDLLRMAMDDEVYRRCWGPFFDADDPDRQRAQLYTSMIIAYWELMFELGAITEAHLREVAFVVFSGDEGQRFWAGSRAMRAVAADTRSERRFHQILDDEYQRASAVRNFSA